jgi:hypothetical protein
VLGGHRQQCAGPLAKPLRTAPGAHSVQLASKPPSAPALHWHLARDHILGIYAHSATQKEHCCSSSQPQVSTAYSLLVLHNYSVFVLFALVQAAPHSHALSGQRHKVAPSWSLASDFPGLDAHFSSIAWTSDTSLVLHFQGSLCTVVAVHSLRSLESAELYVFITQQLPRISCWIPSTST